MLTSEEVKRFLNINDIEDAIVESAISRAEERIKKLLGVDTLPEDSNVKQAWLYLSCAELGSYVNAYYRKREDAEVLNVKMFTAEAERLLKLIPEGLIVRA
jgi:hypothetical protein